ncbi:MAG: chemotaxis protein CheW [Verrucomicrobiota bacterium]
MVYLLFQIGADRYALESSGIVGVQPCVRLKRIPQAAAGVAGVFDYHGMPVPVVDLSALALGQPSRESLSTRIVVVRYEGECLLGLLAEKAVDTARYEEADFHDPGVSAEPYLGPVVTDPQGGIIQRVELARLLTPEVRGVLWRQAREALS